MTSFDYTYFREPIKSLLVDDSNFLFGEAIRGDLKGFYVLVEVLGSKLDTIATFNTRSYTFDESWEKARLTATQYVENTYDYT